MRPIAIAAVQSVIGSFAVGRTQTLLYYLKKLLAEGRVPHVPVYVDSPMGNRVSDLYPRHPTAHRLGLYVAEIPSLFIRPKGMASTVRLLNDTRRQFRDLMQFRREWKGTRFEGPCCGPTV